MEGEGEKNPLIDETKNVSSYVFTAVVFVALLIVLRMTAWKPISRGSRTGNGRSARGWKRRPGRGGGGEDDAGLGGEDCGGTADGGSGLAQAKVDAQKLADSIRAQAEAESVTLKERATRDIEAAKEQAIAEINGHAAEIGTAVARKILQREVRVDDQQRLVDESLAQLGTTGRGREG